MYIDKDEAMAKLKYKYGNLNNNNGFYINNQWFSVSAIIEVLNDCAEYKGNNFR